MRLFVIKKQKLKNQKNIQHHGNNSIIKYQNGRKSPKSILLKTHTRPSLSRLGTENSVKTYGDSYFYRQIPLLMK